MRLTKKNVEIVIDNGTGYGKIYNKLGQLEDIEGKLGIELTVLFEALNLPIYIKENYDGEIVDQTLWCSNSLICGIGEPIIKVSNYAVYKKDYGKTWALRKEDLK